MKAGKSPAAVAGSEPRSVGVNVVGGFDIKFTETTEHEDEAGTGVATAQVAALAAAAGVQDPFNAGPVNVAPFADGPGNDSLRQNFLINITPPAGGGGLLFDFPVDSATAAPEPATLSLFAAGGVLIATSRTRRRKRTAVHRQVIGHFADDHLCQ